MKKTRVLMLRMSEDDYRTVDAFAAAEKIPVSTMIRRHILLEAERRGIVPTGKASTEQRNSGAPVIEAGRAAAVA